VNSTKHEQPTLTDVYGACPAEGGDDVKMTHTSKIIQYNEYYPFGMQSAESYTKANSTNNFLYDQGGELNTTSGWYDLSFRNYDPALGRFHQVDPMATSFYNLTPYNYAGNNPAMINDPGGDRMKMYTEMLNGSNSGGAGFLGGCSCGGFFIGESDLVDDVPYDDGGAGGNGVGSIGNGGLNNAAGTITDADGNTTDFMVKNGVVYVYNKWVVDGDDPWVPAQELINMDPTNQNKLLRAMAQAALGADLTQSSGPNAEALINGLLKMKVGDKITGGQLADILESNNITTPVGISKIIKSLTRVDEGFEVKLTLLARGALALIPKSPDVENGSIISITQEAWPDGKNTVLHLTSPGISIYYDDKLVPLNIYINNNGFTMDKEAYPSYYPIFKGKW
jgi:RHS repeat-associated protein